MSKILIVGNVLKDIYLRLDEHQEAFERDGDDVKWLNVGFNGSTHQFFGRTSIYSGAIVTLEVLRNFGLDTELYGQPTTITSDGFIANGIRATNYRYILTAGEQISYLTPANKHPTVFDANSIPPEFDWVFLDRSAILSRELVANLLNSLEKQADIKLAFYAPKRLQNFAEPLLKKADLVFTDYPIDSKNIKGKLCQISERNIQLGSHKVKMKKLEKTEFFTHLTVYSIIAASVLGGILNHKSEEDTILMAKLNVENMKLDSSVPLPELETLAEEAKESEVNLEQMARQLVASGKGILAADESGGSIHKKFESMNIPDDYEHRRDYRNLFFTTDGLENYVNGVILFDETARQFADDGRDFVKFLTSKGIIPGIKVDKGLANMPGSTEKYTLGLAGLDERLEEYYDMGLRFAKWRAAFEITPNTPTKNTVYKNVEILAQYAKKCQEANIVPIVEPEVVFDGDYPIEHSASITGIILKELFAELARQEVNLKATILKVNMVLAGKKYQTQSTPKEVASWTAKVLREYVPKDLAGVVFLSGGQTPEQATENLQEITNLGPFPWPVTFSYARALQGPALEAWKGNNDNYPKAKAAFKERLEANCKALKKSA
ncbi:fructose-bisphosphate aldolase class I [Candidatus Saccharibacteria bacterium]|nr:fructose-bisphosphate aldolase class I [Candidatus Saccharibacteria bacterium]